MHITINMKQKRCPSSSQVEEFLFNVLKQTNISNVNGDGVLVCIVESMFYRAEVVNSGLMRLQI